MNGFAFCLPGTITDRSSLTMLRNFYFCALFFLYLDYSGSMCCWISLVYSILLGKIGYARLNSRFCFSENLSLFSVIMHAWSTIYWQKILICIVMRNCCLIFCFFLFLFFFFSLFLNMGRCKLISPNWEDTWVPWMGCHQQCLPLVMNVINGGRMFRLL